MRRTSLREQFHLASGQSDPKPPPGGEFFVRGEEIAHLGAGISGTKRGLVTVFVHGSLIPRFNEKEKTGNYCTTKRQIGATPTRLFCENFIDSENAPTGQALPGYSP